MNVNRVMSATFTSTTVESPDKKKHLTDTFQTKLKNSADMNDCIMVPRTIFKGYLGIMTGTTLGAIASLMKPSIAKKATALAGILTSMYGTYAFVRPYIIKDAVPTVSATTNQQQSK